MKREKLLKFPKVDLHCHLDGSVRVGTVYDLAKREGVKLPTEDHKMLEKYVQVPKTCKSLTEFLAAFEFFYPLLKSPYAMERVAYELCGDCASENIRYFEMRFAPFLQATEKHSMEDITKAVIKGTRDGIRDFKIDAGIILCAYRSTPLESCVEAVRLATKYKEDLVCGVDLAGDESNYKSELYEKAFALARKNRLNITVHAGEAAGAESIKSAIELLGAKRIGHGIRLREDPDLFEYVRKKEIPLEICVTSNIQTQTVRDFPLHPIKEYFDKGIAVTLNTDDRSVSGIDLTNEWEVAIREYGFTLKDLFKMNLTALENAFIYDKDKKKKLIEKYKQEIKEK